MTWRNKIEASGKPGVVTGGQGYAVDYDNVNRITASNYYTQTAGTFTPSATDAFNEKVTDYDEMGNINRLDRSDKTGTLQNSLYYTYGTNGNKLTSIYDNVLHPKSGTFSYDGNGNMVTDTYSGITVSYNYLDLPDTVKNGSDKLVFTYDAAGNKLYQMLYIGGNLISQRHYIDGSIVTASPSVPVDGKIESITMDEGRVVNTGVGGYKYEYNLQDHQFNNRVNFRVDHDGTVNLSQVRNYYPFGEMMGDSTMNYALTPVDLFQYSGKELQPGLDLNTYDFGARNYNPVLARWWSMDPLAASSESQSPYGYVGDDPLNMIDPDGMQQSTPCDIDRNLGGTLNGVNIHSGGGAASGGASAVSSGGSGIPWAKIGTGATIIDAGLQVFSAFNATKMSFKQIENFSTYNQLQGNVIRPSNPIMQFASNNITFDYANQGSSGGSPDTKPTDNSSLWPHFVGPGLIALGQPIKYLKPIGALDSKPGSSIASYTLSKVLPQRFTKVLGREAGEAVVEVVGTNVIGRALGRFIPYLGWSLTAFDIYSNRAAIGAFIQDMQKENAAHKNDLLWHVH